MRPPIVVSWSWIIFNSNFNQRFQSNWSFIAVWCSWFVLLQNACYRRKTLKRNPYINFFQTIGQCGLQKKNYISTYRITLVFSTNEVISSEFTSLPFTYLWDEITVQTALWIFFCILFIFIAYLVCLRPWYIWHKKSYQTWYRPSLRLVHWH